MKRLVVTLLISAAASLAAPPARAELWSALDTVPRPNAVVGYDTSVTMRINPNCTNCHRDGLAAHRERVNVARQDLLATMPLFRDYFIFGAFEYQGCGYAKIVNRSTPLAATPDVSYTNAYNLIAAARGCNSSEDYFPGGSITRCIAPHPVCANDPPIVEDILRGALPGFTVPPLPTATSTVCGNPARVAPTYDLEAALISRSAGLQWPRWDSATLTSRHVIDDLCGPIESVLNGIRTELNRCLVDPDAFWDLTVLDGGYGGWCDPNVIAGSACSGGPFTGTCVCDGAADPLCQLGGTRNSNCGPPLFWKARQQVAVCESYDPTTFGQSFRNQADNRINTGGCRENVAMFFTDGYQGHTAGVAAEAVAAQPTYGSASGQPNMFVFRVSNSFTSEANRMMQSVSNGQLNTAFSATNPDQMKTSFSQVLARIYRGDFGGSGISISPSDDRIAVSSFVVPGHTAGAPVDDRYIGWPLRVAVHSIDDAGTISATPTFQTDWASKVGVTGTCGYHEINSPNVALLGPGGTFDNGVARNVAVPAGSLGDRDSDGLADPPYNLRWGRAYGFAAGKPIIVEGPNEAPNPEWGLEWGDHLTNYGNRPRMVYTWAGGYVLGFHGGAFTGAGRVGTSYVSGTYDDSSAEAGTEVLRYRPSWMAPGAQSGHNPKFDVTLNPLVPQKLTTGDLIAREIWIDDGTPRFRTLLMGTQGKEGAGVFVLDISNPCSPALMAEWLLPVGAYASARPEIYYFPEAAAPQQRAALVTTGGLDGLPLLLAYDVRNGTELSRITLPYVTGTSYPSAPVCVDVSGEGVITHCYALRSDGLVARVEVDLAGTGFSTVADITPIVGGVPATIGGGRSFVTEPAVFFGTDGAVNLVFGSGSHENLTVPGPQNYVYKIVDEGSRQNSAPAGPAAVEGVCGPDLSSSTRGIFPLGPGDRVISAPVVADGVVAWTSYQASTSGCVSGTASLYAMRFDTCEDALATTNARPQPISLGAGIPTSPVVHRKSGTVLARTSANPDADDAAVQSADLSSPGRPWARKLYWRYELDVR